METSSKIPISREKVKVDRNLPFTRQTFRVLVCEA